MIDISTKSIGSLIDELSIVNIKCFMSQEKLMDENLSDKERLDAAIAAQKLNAKRNVLIRKIDELLGYDSLSPTEKTYK